MSGPLVLSLFPGADLFGMAFESEGFCVVRGPDRIFGGDVRQFHVPAGRFDGVIGGPPCTAFSRIRYVNPKAGQRDGNLIPEFERVVAEAQPAWFVMENVPEAPLPSIAGYRVAALLFNNRWAPDAPDQHRRRRFSFGTRDGRALAVEVCALESGAWAHAVTASGATRDVPIALVRSKDGLRPKKTPLHSCEYTSAADYARACERQGLPADFLVDAPFTLNGKHRLVGNGVPLFTGRAIARAVRRALGIDTPSEVAQ